MSNWSFKALSERPSGAWLMLCVLICSSAPSCFGADDNLLKNGSFEQGEGPRPIGWAFTPPTAGEWRADGGHDGERYLRIADPEARTGISVESERLPARPGGQYRATAWLRMADRCQPGLYINFYDEAGQRVHHVYSRVAGPTAGWTLVRVEATAPAEAMTVSVLLYAYIGDVGVFDADEVALSVRGGADPGTGGIPVAPLGPKETVEIGTRRELFVDSFLIDSLSGTARRQLHTPQRRAVVLQLEDVPWEGVSSAYFTIMLVEGKIRLYYRGSGPEEAYHEVTCVAESEDGLHFTRPRLGLFEWQGNKETNIVWQGPGAHNFTPFLDANPAAKPEERFKALASAGPNGTLVAFVSADGYRWHKLREEPVITKGAFDSQNLAFWDPLRRCYVEYHRGFRDGVRDIMTSTSADFIQWTEPQWLDYGGAPPEHLYTNAITPYFRAPHIYLGFPNRFLPTRHKILSHREPGVNDALLMSSRDGVHFERWREAFLYPTLEPENWTQRNNYIAWGLVPLNEREIGLYATEHYEQPGARLVLYTIRPDGFVSVYADMAGGQLLTRPLIFAGRKLEINYATSAAGSLRVALCDPAGKAYPGFSLAESELIYGNELAHIVRWATGEEVSALAGKPVRLRINLRDAHLFSFRFVE